MLFDIQKNLLNTNDERLQALRGYYKISPEMAEACKDRVRDWYKNQPHLPKVLEENYMKRHLSLLKYDVEKTKKKMDALFTARALIPDCFGDRDPWSDRISKALESIDMVTMPTLTDDHCRVCVLKLNIKNNEVFDLTMSFVCTFMLADIRLHVDNTRADIYVCDIGNLTFNQIKQIHLPTLKRILFILQSCIGTPIQSIHIINAPTVAELALGVVKTALKKKVADRFTIHSTMESFCKVFPMKFLPQDMGGNVPYTLNEISAQWEKAIKTPEMRKWFMELDTKKSDESKRLKKRDFLPDDMVGVRGTFRKLDLD